MKTQGEKLKEINDVLVAVTTYDSHFTNNEIIEKEKFNLPEFYCAVKKLQFIKRVDSHDNRKVLNTKAVTMKEYQSASDPYGKRDRDNRARKEKRKALTPAKKGTVSKKVAREAVKHVSSGIYLLEGEGKTHETLKAPLDLPIYSHASGAEISISGSAEGVARFLKLLNAMGY